MSSFVSCKFHEIEEMDLFLNGGLVGAVDVINGAEGNYGVYGLVGKTLKFIQPSATTVLFVASADPNNPDPNRLTYKDIKEQVEAAIGAVSVQQRMRKLVLIEATPTNGVTIDKTGTANPFLGFDKNTDTVGTKYGSIGGTAPSLQNIQVSDSVIVVTVYK
jgi:hypothetical protein